MSLFGYNFVLIFWDQPTKINSHS